MNFLRQFDVFNCPHAGAVLALGRKVLLPIASDGLAREECRQACATKQPAEWLRLHRRQMLVTAFVFCTATARAGSARAQQPVRWVGTWAAAMQSPEAANALPMDDYREMTLRQIVHLSIGGSMLRVKLSNVFGTTPLHLAGVHLARPLSAAASVIDAATDKALTFDGRSDVIIPAGAEYWSDAVAFTAAPLSDLAVSIHYDMAPQGQTGHPGSRATSYYVHGDATARTGLANETRIEHWYQLTEVDVATSTAQSAAVVAFGDSITDGHGATTNGNDRWPDLLARRLQAVPGGTTMGVLNAGIGGNRMLLDSLGPNALARFDRDVLARSGATIVILLEGINDLGTLTINGEATAAQHRKLVQTMIAAYQQVVVRSHARGIFVIGATILPDGGSGFYHPAPASENDREAINAWIRTPGHFDAVTDFDRVVADPAHPDRLMPAYDSGDHLHPSPAGYKRMAESVDLGVLEHAISITR